MSPAVQQVGDVARRQGEHAAQVPPGQREHTRLQRIEHRQQQMRTANAVDVVVDVVEIGVPQRRGDHSRCGASDSVRRKDAVVRCRRAGQRFGEVGADPRAERFAGDLVALVGVDVVLVAVRPVHELVGQFVVVLQRVHQRRRIHTQLDGGTQCEAQEFGVGRRQSMVVGGPVDEVVGQVGAGAAGLLDVVDRQIEFLEGEAAELAHHAANELVGSLRQRMPPPTTRPRLPRRSSPRRGIRWRPNAIRRNRGRSANAGHRR